MKNIIRVLALLSIINAGFAFECYSCSTVDDPACGDAFNSEHIIVSECVAAQYDTLLQRHPKFETYKMDHEFRPQCVRYDGIDVNGQVQTVRACSLLGPDTCAVVEKGAIDEGSQITKCVACGSHLCNSATSTTLLPVLLIITLTGIKTLVL